MISEIQNKLQKHNKVVFFVLLAVIIVAFVFTIGAAPGLGGDQATARQDFFGYNLQSERDKQEITKLGSISYRIQFDEQPDPARFDNFLIERIAYLGLANKLHIPGPTIEQFQAFVGQLPAFQNNQGRYDRSKFDFFIDDVEANPTISTGDVALVIDQDFRIQRARDLLGGPGYVLPTEVRLQLERTKTVWTLDLARFDVAGFTPEIEVTDESIETFFEENEFRYERSPRIDFSYAVFSPEKFIDRVGELAEEDVIRHYEQNRERFTPQFLPTEEIGDEPVEQPEVTLDDVREGVEQELRLRRARRIAGNAAADFAYALFQDGERPGDSGFEALLEQYRGELRDAPPASQEDFPTELGFPRQVQERVFRLSSDRDFSDPLEVRDHYIVLIYEDTLPAYVPPLADIRPQVESDYRDQERRRLLSLKGEELRENIRNRIDEGATFIEAAEAEGLEAESVEPFSLTPPFPPEVPQQLLGRLDEFKQGRLAPMVSVQDSAYFVFVQDRTVPEIDRDSNEFVQVADRTRMMSSMSNQHFVLQEFIERATNTNTQGR